MTLLDNRLDKFSATLINSPTGNNYQSYSQNLLQQKINSEWAYATDKYTVQEEQTFGMQDWQSLEVRITHILPDSNTGDMRKGDDWRGIKFEDLSHYYAIGIRYQFDNNVWLTVDSDYYHFVTASAVLRRCDNVLKWYDSGGILRQEPCIIEGKVQRYRNEYGQYMTTYEGYISVICQQNQYTNQINIGQRFIFNGRAYKVINPENYHNKTTYGQDSPLLTLIMNRDMNNSEVDNNNIANSFGITPSSTPTTGNFITPNVTSIIQNNTQTYNVNHYVNGVADSNTFTITASGADPKYYQLNIINSNSFSVKSLGYISTPLIVTAKNNIDGTTVQISIQLKGLW